MGAGASPVRPAPGIQACACSARRRRAIGRRSWSRCWLRSKRSCLLALDYEALSAEIAALRRKQLFFIGGAAKSGTTWLQLLLDRHPAISCNGEGHFPTY